MSHPSPNSLSLPASLIWFMLASLVIMTVLNLSFIANEAHMGGFVAGIVCGGIAAFVSRRKRAQVPGRNARD